MRTTLSRDRLALDTVLAGIPACQGDPWPVDERTATDSSGWELPEPRASTPPVGIEATELQQIAEGRGITMRLVGSLAIALRCPHERGLLTLLGRRPPRDIDLIAYSTEEKKIAGLLAERGYESHPSVSHSREWGVKRLIYTHPAQGFKVDVFLDELVMAHTIGFAGRLELEPYTVPLADLLLSKLQIYRITENDLIDLVVLFAEHDLGPAPAGIDAARVASVLGADWGFFHGASQNLDGLDDAIARFDVLPTATSERVRDRVARLRVALKEAPKTSRWRLRARIGTRAPWYEHVDDVEV